MIAELGQFLPNEIALWFVFAKFLPLFVVVVSAVVVVVVVMLVLSKKRVLVYHSYST